jgi:hypothetical protein
MYITKKDSFRGVKGRNEFSSLTKIVVLYLNFLKRDAMSKTKL